MANIQTIQAAFELADAMRQLQSDPKGTISAAIRESYPMIAAAEAKLQESSQKIADAEKALANVEAEKKSFLDYKKSQLDNIDALNKAHEAKSVSLEISIAEHAKSLNQIAADRQALTDRQNAFEQTVADTKAQQAAFDDREKQIEAAHSQLDIRANFLDNREKAIAIKESEVKAYEASMRDKAAKAAAILA